MEILRIVLATVYVLVGAYILYFLFYRKNPDQAEYEKLYNKILHGDEFKVKGQWNPSYRR